MFGVPMAEKPPHARQAAATNRICLAFHTGLPFVEIRRGRLVACGLRPQWSERETRSGRICWIVPPPKPAVNSQEEPRPTVNSREEAPVRVAVDGVRIECAEADEFEELDDFESKAASRVMTQDGDVPIRR